MKILYVINMFPKLSESFILNEIVELLKNGHDVQIFSIIKPWEEEVHDEIKKYNILERTHYFSFKSILKINIISFLKYLLFGVIQDLYDLRLFIQAVSKPKATHTQSSIVHPNKKIESNIHRIERFGIACPRRFILDLKIAYFATIVEDKNVKLIHTHFASMGGIARRLSKMLGLPYTLTAHAFEIFMNPNIEVLNQNLDDAVYVFTPSKYNKQYLIDLTICEQSKIEIIHATINPKKFVRTKQCDTKQIIMAARLVEKKGMKYMIKAMKNIAMQDPEAVLKIIGDGPLWDELNDLVQKYNLDKNVKFLGSISDERYYKELEASLIAVLPCIITENGDRDVCPLTLQESMSMELPIVSTNVHSIPELIDDGVSGILVPPKDEKALVDAVIELLGNPELRYNMGKNGRKKIMEEFNIEVQVNKQVALWQENQNQ